jgi:hypothetical protein
MQDMQRLSNSWQQGSSRPVRRWSTHLCSCAVLWRIDQHQQAARLVGIAQAQGAVDGCCGCARRPAAANNKQTYPMCRQHRRTGTMQVTVADAHITADGPKLPSHCCPRTTKLQPRLKCWLLEPKPHLSGPMAVPCPIQLLPPDMEVRRSPRSDSTEPCTGFHSHSTHPV